MDKVTYLGDGVYCEFDGYGYILRANHHTDEECTSMIYIEPNVYHKLIEYVTYINSCIQYERKLKQLQKEEAK